MRIEVDITHYDVIVAQEVVAHVPDQARFVEILATALKPGGYLVISAANRIVMERVDFGPDPREHIKRWLTLGELKRLVRPRLRVLRGRTIIPLGDRGLLRIVNSERLNRLVGWFVPRERLEAWKERAGLGYSVIVLASTLAARQRNWPLLCPTRRARSWLNLAKSASAAHGPRGEGASQFRRCEVLDSARSRYMLAP